MRKMFKDKNKRIKLLIILGIVFLFGLTTYYTYAYFSSEVTGNEDANKVEVTTGILLLEYNDKAGTLLSVYNAMPGVTASKEFTVKNVGTFDTSYDILWKDVVNNFADKTDLYYTLTCSSDNEDGECRDVTSSTQMPNTTSNQEIVKSIDIKVGETHTYKLEVSFPNKDEDQNDNQGKSVTANVQIVEYSKPTITMDVQDGTIDRVSSIVEYAGSDTFTVTPNTGYYLENMNVSCNNTSNITITNNQVTIGPVFLSNTCNVTFTPSYDIHGYVVDQNDTPVANATVEVHSSVRTAVTDATGYFEINSVITGDHELKVIRNEESLHDSSFRVQKNHEFNIAGNTITAVETTKPIKIKVTLETETEKTIEVDNTYRVTINAVNGSTSKELDRVESGNSSSINVTPNTGYTYTSINCTNGVNGVWNNNTLSIDSVEKDTACTVGFGAETYELSMDTHNTPGILYKNVIYDAAYGELPNQTKEYYNFNGWFTSETGGSEVTSETIVTTASNHTIHAQYSPKSYDVIYNCTENSGTCNIPNASVVYGTSIDLSKSSSKSGYTFIGWNTDKDATVGLSSLIMDTAGKTLYAIYEKTINVTYNSNGSSISKSSDSCTIYNNASECTFTSPTITKAGYTIVGFNTTEGATTSSLNNNTSYTVNANKTYYAVTYKDVTVTFNANGNTVSKSSDTCRIQNSATTCSVTSATITANANTPTVIGFSTTATNHTSSWTQNTSKSFNADAVYFAQTSSSEVTKNVAYQVSTGITSIGKTSDSCTIGKTYNGVSQDTTCTVTSPTAVASEGYNARYFTTSQTATSGISPESEITLTNASTTYYAKANDTTKPSCSFNTLNYLGVGQTGTITLTCIDKGSGLSSQTLSASNFTSSSTGIGTITNVSSPVSVTNGYKYTVTLSGVSEGVFTISLNASSIGDNSTNKNDKTTSSNITVSNLTLSPSSGVAYISGTAVTSEISGSGYGTLSCNSSSTSTATCSISGTTLSVTGLSKGTATITVNGSNGNVTASYTVTVKQKVSIPDTSYCTTPTYTGSVQAITSSASEGYTFSGNTGTNATSYTVTATLNTNYAWSDGTIGTKTISCSIAKKSVTYTALGASQTYNGSALTNTSGCSLTSGTLVSGHSVTCTNSGSITNAGTETNTLSTVVIKSGSTDVSSNYSITKANGTLTVNKKAVTVTSGSTSRVYDGNALTNGTCTANSLVSGHTVTCTNTGTITNVGSATNTLSTAVIKDSSSNDVSSNYTITKANGTLTITNATLSNGSVSITGSAKVGQVLTASVSNTSPTATYTYQWYTNTSNSTSGGTAISGATGSTFTITTTQLGKYIYVIVTATKANYTTKTFSDITDATANTWATIVENVAPTITLGSNSNTTYAKSQSVTVTVADTTGIKASQGIKYGWSTSDTTAPSSYTTVTLSNSAGATSTTFTASSTNTLTGQYYLWVVPNTSVCDTVNNCNTATVKSTGLFYFDNTGPSISSFTASPSQTTVSLSNTATDSASGVSKYYYGYTENSTCSGVTYYESDNNTYSFVITTSKTYLACTYVTDKLSNPSAVSSASFVINNDLKYSEIAASYSCANAKNGSAPYKIVYTGNCSLISDGNDNWRMKLLSGGSFTISKSSNVDIFIVGGGGGGSSYYGCGGGGGKTITYSNVAITTSAYSVTIGGGGGGASPTSGGGTGGTSYFGTSYYASGGGGGSSWEGSGSGGSGGSGGGGTFANGGSDGSNGGSSSPYNGGGGQLTTTREFGESSGTLYSGGGGGQWGSGGSGGGAAGGGDYNASSASSNTGGGGGGADGDRYAGAGGSGIVVIRNSR